MQSFPDNERFRKLLFHYPVKAIQFLYEYYYNDLLKISKNLTHDHHASEDILQEVFFHVYEKHKWLGQHHEKSIDYYLVKVVQNKSISFYKKERRISALKVKYKGEYVDMERTVEDSIISLEIITHIQKLIASFPRREQQCYLWSREKDMTYKQIAERLNITQKAVERSISSARKRLRKHWIFPDTSKSHF